MSLNIHQFIFNTDHNIDVTQNHISDDQKDPVFSGISRNIDRRDQSKKNSYNIMINFYKDKVGSNYDRQASNM